MILLLSLFSKLDAYKYMCEVVSLESEKVSLAKCKFADNLAPRDLLSDRPSTRTTFVDVYHGVEKACGHATCTFNIVFHAASPAQSLLKLEVLPQFSGCELIAFYILSFILAFA